MIYVEFPWALFLYTPLFYLRLGEEKIFKKYINWIDQSKGDLYTSYQPDTSSGISRGPCLTCTTLCIFKVFRFQRKNLLFFYCFLFSIIFFSYQLFFTGPLHNYLTWFEGAAIEVLTTVNKYSIVLTTSRSRKDF